MLLFYILEDFVFVRSPLVKLRGMIIVDKAIAG